ncbi:hypothetical protein H8959_022411 [Pygathrix nigripes]
MARVASAQGLCDITKGLAPEAESSWPSRRPISLSIKEKNNASLNKDCAFNTLHELDVELARFVSEVRSLKGAMATGNVSNLKLRRSETPTHPRVMIYDIWGEESSS